MSESESRVSASAVSRRRGALLALTLLALTTFGPLVVEATPAPNEDAESDDESDFAPFAIVVEHGAGDAAWYCGGSLVSLRTALTSAWCARGKELSALAAAAVPSLATSYKDGVRRVARVAFATELGVPPPGETEDSEPAVDDAWRGASLDLALLELEAPFGPTVSARPILMATEAAACGAPGACHAAGVRARAARPLLRVADLQLARRDACAERAPHWAAVQDSALCLSGVQLCPSDRGAGVVCGGMLCGVLSRSAGGAGGTGCGDTHAAQSVARWRRFLQCAHTLRACGRDGDCAHLCSERQLLPEAEPELRAAEGAAGVEPRPPRPPPAHLRPLPPRPTTTTLAPLDDDERPAPSPEPDTAPEVTTPSATTWTTRMTKSTGRSRKNKGGVPPTRSPAPLATLPPGTSPPLQQPRMEFDPSRADFKQAGEYGDNAADYAGMGDEMVSSSTPAGARSPPRLAPTRSAPPHSPRAAPPSAARLAPSSAAPTAALMDYVNVPRQPPAANSATPHSHRLYSTFCIFYIFVFIVNIVS